ncbi:MAG: hypothetical protein JJT77_01095 [Crocinitomicaceae bacterium]|nr:hypothetical protein [Crocinitomicaceae bacterium]
MSRLIVFLIISWIIALNQLSGQTFQRGFNYEEGSITLKNRTILHGEVANIKHGFRGKILTRIRIKLPGKCFTKNYHPRKILGFSMGNRQFVSWRVKRNNNLFREIYTIHAGKQYQIFELHKEGHLSIYLKYFIDEDLHIRSVPFFLKKDEILLVRATQGIFGLKQNMLSDYFADCPPLIKLIRERKITTPEEVAIFYNNYIDEQLHSK